jgi:hypothetical protein
MVAIPIYMMLIHRKGLSAVLALLLMGIPACVGVANSSSQRHQDAKFLPTSRDFQVTLLIYGSSSIQFTTKGSQFSDF